MNRLPTHARLIAVMALVCSATCVHGAGNEEPADDTGFEEFDRLEVESVLPPRFLHSAHYSIDPVVIADDNFYRFSVSTDSATYKISSLAMLRVRLHEIVTIAELIPRLTAKKISFDRSPGGRRGVESERVLDIFTDPVSTATTLLGNIEYNVEKTFSEAEPEALPRLRGASNQDLNPDAHKRSAASQLGVDVYSSNPEMQRLLNTVGAARSAGKIGSSISPLVRNPYAQRPFGSGVLNQRLDSHLKNMSSEDLHAEVEGSLRDLDVAAATRITFLTHPAYTPRTRLYLTTYATLLKSVHGLGQLFAAANGARSEADAMAYVSFARMLAYYQLQTGMLSEVITQARFPTLLTRDGNAVLALPIDYLAWTPAIEEAANALRTIRESRGIDHFSVLLAGTPTTRTSAELLKRRVELHPDYSY